MTQAKPIRGDTPEPKVPHPAVRLILSVLFALHLTGVFVAPMGASIATAYGLFPNRQADFVLLTERPPVMPDQQPERPWLLRIYQPYLQIAYLDHGYNFFAPDPGPSFLIRYRATMEDGQVEEGTFPNLKEQWPRLRYHRHFMLTSMAQGMPPGSGQWYARHLLNALGAEHIRLELVRHRLLTPEEMLAGRRLDDPDTYQVLDSLTFQRGQEVVPPVPPPASPVSPYEFGEPSEPEVIAVPREAF